MVTRFILRNPDVRRNCLMEIQQLPLDKYEVEIREVRRSGQANNLYWKWLSIISGVTGFTPDELHESFKGHFLGMEDIKDMFGLKYTRPCSSAKLKKADFSDYMRKVEIYAATQNITLPTGAYYGHDYYVTAQPKEGN